MKLNARQIDTAKPKEKAYKLADGGGLYLLVKPSGGKYWRFKYRVAGKEKLLALGVYPEVTLADARAKREEAKRGIAGGIDPMEAKREEKIARETQLNNTFKDIALEWHSSKLKKWSAGYASDILEAFNKDVFPYIGKKPIAEIKPLELLNVLRRIEGRGATEKAKKVRQRCGKFSAMQLSLDVLSITLHRISPARCKVMNLIIILSSQPKNYLIFSRHCPVTQEVHWLLWRLVY